MSSNPKVSSNETPQSPSPSRNTIIPPSPNNTLPPSSPTTTIHHHTTIDPNQSILHNYFSRAELLSLFRILIGNPDHSTIMSADPLTLEPLENVGVGFLYGKSSDVFPSLVEKDISAIFDPSKQPEHPSLFIQQQFDTIHNLEQITHPNPNTIIPSTPLNQSQSILPRPTTTTSTPSTTSTTLVQPITNNLILVSHPSSISNNSQVSNQLTYTPQRSLNQLSQHSSNNHLVQYDPQQDQLLQQQQANLIQPSLQPQRSNLSNISNSDRTSFHEPVFPSTTLIFPHGQGPFATNFDFNNDSLTHLGISKQNSENNNVQQQQQSQQLQQHQHLIGSMHPVDDFENLEQFHHNESIIQPTNIEESQQPEHQQEAEPEPQPPQEVKPARKSKFLFRNTQNSGGYTLPTSILEPEIGANDEKDKLNEEDRQSITPQQQPVSTTSQRSIHELQLSTTATTYHESRQLTTTPTFQQQLMTTTNQTYLSQSTTIQNYSTSQLPPHPSQHSQSTSIQTQELHSVFPIAPTLIPRAQNAFLHLLPTPTLPSPVPSLPHTHSQSFHQHPTTPTVMNNQLQITTSIPPTPTSIHPLTPIPFSRQHSTALVAVPSTSITQSTLLPQQSLHPQLTFQFSKPYQPSQLPTINSPASTPNHNAINTFTSQHTTTTIPHSPVAITPQLTHVVASTPSTPTTDVNSNLITYSLPGTIAPPIVNDPNSLLASFQPSKLGGTSTVYLITDKSHRKWVYKPSLGEQFRDQDAINETPEQYQTIQRTIVENTLQILYMNTEIAFIQTNNEQLDESNPLIQHQHDSNDVIHTTKSDFNHNNNNNNNNSHNNVSPNSISHTFSFPIQPNSIHQQQSGIANTIQIEPIQHSSSQTETVPDGLSSFISDSNLYSNDVSNSSQFQHNQSELNRPNSFSFQQPLTTTRSILSNQQFPKQQQIRYSTEFDIKSDDDEHNNHFQHFNNNSNKNISTTTPNTSRYYIQPRPFSHDEQQLSQDSNLDQVIGRKSTSLTEMIDYNNVSINDTLNNLSMSHDLAQSQPLSNLQQQELDCNNKDNINAESNYDRNNEQGQQQQQQHETTLSDIDSLSHMEQLILPTVSLNAISLSQSQTVHTNSNSSNHSQSKPIESTLLTSTNYKSNDIILHPSHNSNNSSSNKTIINESHDQSSPLHHTFDSNSQPNDNTTIQSHDATTTESCQEPNQSYFDSTDSSSTTMTTLQQQSRVHSSIPASNQQIPSHPLTTHQSQQSSPHHFSTQVNLKHQSSPIPPPSSKPVPSIFSTCPPTASSATLHQNNYQHHHHQEKISFKTTQQLHDDSNTTHTLYDDIDSIQISRLEDHTFQQSIDLQKQNNMDKNSITNPLLNSVVDVSAQALSYDIASSPFFGSIQGRGSISGSKTPSLNGLSRSKQSTTRSKMQSGGSSRKYVTTTASVHSNGSNNQQPQHQQQHQQQPTIVNNNDMVQNKLNNNTAVYSLSGFRSTSSVSTTDKYFSTLNSLSTIDMNTTNSNNTSSRTETIQQSQQKQPHSPSHSCFVNNTNNTNNNNKMSNNTSFSTSNFSTTSMQTSTNEFSQQLSQRSDIFKHLSLQQQQQFNNPQQQVVIDEKLNTTNFNNSKLYTTSTTTQHYHNNTIGNNNQQHSNYHGATISVISSSHTNNTLISTMTPTLTNQTAQGPKSISSSQVQQSSTKHQDVQHHTNISIYSPQSHQHIDNTQIIDTQLQSNHNESHTIASNTIFEASDDDDIDDNDHYNQFEVTPVQRNQGKRYSISSLQPQQQPQQSNIDPSSGLINNNSTSSSNNNNNNNQQLEMNVLTSKSSLNQSKVQSKDDVSSMSLSRNESRKKQQSYGTKTPIFAPLSKQQSNKHSKTQDFGFNNNSNQSSKLPEITTSQLIHNDSKNDITESVTSSTSASTTPYNLSRNATNTTNNSSQQHDHNQEEYHEVDTELLLPRPSLKHHNSNTLLHAFQSKQNQQPNLINHHDLYSPDYSNINNISTHTNQQQNQSMDSQLQLPTLTSHGSTTISIVPTITSTINSSPNAIHLDTTDAKPLPSYLPTPTTQAYRPFNNNNNNSNAEYQSQQQHESHNNATNNMSDLPQTFTRTEPYTRQSIRQGIRYGESTMKELASYLIDPEIVPKTYGLITAIYHKSLDPITKQIVLKKEYIMGSIQEFIPNHGSLENYGPSMICAESMHRVAILDIRILNTDRHEDNLLAIKHNSLPKGVYEDDDYDDSYELDPKYLLKFPIEKQKQIIEYHNEQQEKNKIEKFERTYKLHQQATRLKPFRDYLHSICNGDYDYETGVQLNKIHGYNPNNINFENDNNGHDHHEHDHNDHDVTCEFYNTTQHQHQHDDSQPYKQTCCSKRSVTAVPIDHSLSLPSIFNMSQIRFEWLSNTEITTKPFSRATLKYISDINILSDALKLHQVGIHPESILASCCATLVLKHCSIVEGLFLSDIGQLFVRNHYIDSEKRCPFEQIVTQAICAADHQSKLYNLFEINSDIFKTDSTPSHSSHSPFQHDDISINDTTSSFQNIPNSNHNAQLQPKPDEKPGALWLEFFLSNVLIYLKKHLRANNITSPLQSKKSTD